MLVDFFNFSPLTKEISELNVLRGVQLEQWHCVYTTDVYRSVFYFSKVILLK